jgi:hypothetical protein
VEGQEEVAVRVRREILVERHRLGDGRIVLDGATLKEVEGPGLRRKKNSGLGRSKMKI